MRGAIVTNAGTQPNGGKDGRRSGRNPTRLGILATTVALLGLLGGCGGSSGSDSEVVATPTTAAPLTAVPASVSANESGFFGFLLQLQNNDTAEPLTLDGAAPPTSESSEPFAL